MTFAERASLASAHERAVVEHFQRYGYRLVERADAWSERARAIMCRSPFLLGRWRPELLIERVRDDWLRSPPIFYVDAKATFPGQQRIAIELAALDAHERLADAENIAVYYVCGATFRVADGATIRRVGLPGPPPGPRGSGTPYCLVDPRALQPFEAVFGAVP
jgi:hypothetical protein